MILRPDGYTCLLSCLKMLEMWKKYNGKFVEGGLRYRTYQPALIYRGKEHRRGN